MKVVLLLLALIAFIVVVSKFAQFMTKKIERIETETETEIEGFKEVLKKDNCSSTTKPSQDFNDKQNLTKFNHGTYRDEKGRFKSKKEWKKEHETS
jgi:hypothetical protein